MYRYCSSGSTCSAGVIAGGVGVETDHAGTHVVGVGDSLEGGREGGRGRERERGKGVGQNRVECSN